MHPQTFIFFGPSGSGKGTQARLLIDALKQRGTEKKILYLETGDKLREFAEEASLTAKLTKEVIDSGGLIPEFLPIWVWTEFMVKHLSGEEHLIIDGSPRKLDESEILGPALKFYNREQPTIIFVRVFDEWATEKLIGRGRVDDTRAGIQNRLNWYKENVVPAMEYFKKDPYYKFISINGEQTIEEVHQEILEKTGI